jgi:hypothetical protein
MNILLYSWWDGEVPFYIGIGNPGRETEWRKRNPHCYAKRKSAEAKGTFKVLIEFTGLSWEEAWELEKKRIAEIGMISRGTGTLTNYAEGGNGGNTQKGWTTERLQEYKNLMRERMSGILDYSAMGKKGGAKGGRSKSPRKRHKNRSSQTAANVASTGCKYITNGRENKRIFPGEKIPEGWDYGMTKSHYRGKPL